MNETKKFTLARDFTLYYFIRYCCKERNVIPEIDWTSPQVLLPKYSQICSGSNIIYYLLKNKKVVWEEIRVTHGRGKPHFCHMCWINIWAYTHWLSLRGRCKYRNYTHAYFTGIRQIAHLAGSDDRPAPNLCLHRRQQKERLCHVCAEKLGHEKATSFPPLRGRIHSRSTVSTSRKLFEKCNQIYERSGEAVEQLIAKHPPPPPLCGSIQS